MTNAQAFDQAFRPTDRQVDRLGALFTTITSRGYIVQMQADCYARVNGNPVTDYDCYYCGEEVGRHTGQFCVHQEAMFEAIDAQDAADEYDTYRAALGVGVQ